MKEYEAIIYEDGVKKVHTIEAEPEQTRNVSLGKCLMPMIFTLRRCITNGSSQKL